MTPSLIEAVARAILAERYQLENGRLNTNISWETIDENTRVRYLDQARAALQSIEASGYAIVPVEPTEDMLDAPDWRADAGKGAYAALLSARPRVT